MAEWKLQARADGPLVSGPVLLVVMDGVGIGRGDEGDAVQLARKPTLDRLARLAASTQLKAHGTAVGLPSDEDMGNSEVGHNALGAGRVFAQGATRVRDSIRSGELFKGDIWQSTTARCRERQTTLHFIGLLSDGNVHSHIDHLYAMMRRAHEDGVQRARVHTLLDGRDVPETSALEFIRPLEAFLAELNAAGRDYRIASGGGRMTVTMDRYEADWPMVERGWNLHVHGHGRRFRSAEEAVVTFRDEHPGIIDQNLPGFVVRDEEGSPNGPIRDGDAVILFNFRGDRAIEISRAFTEDDFQSFGRGRRPDVLFAGMMQYDGDLLIPPRFLVAPPAIDRTVGEYLARNGVSQFACSETQKYGHVTYFWNGNRSNQFEAELETYCEIPSDPLPCHERPWMRAAEITDVTIDALRSGRYRHLRINYANGDMVGHTGHRDAAVLAVEAVDLCLARLLSAVAALDGAIIVTADHGNADEMYEWDKKKGELARRAGSHSASLSDTDLYVPKTSHTLNPVPFYVWAPGRSLQIDSRITDPSLTNVAAVVLHLLGFHAPDEYDPSLLR